MQRVISTQKLPTVADPFRAKPRTTTIATAIPTAGVTNCSTMSAPIWLKFDMVVSPP